jgi:Leucine-rich repeat (LRR) protein
LRTLQSVGNCLTLQRLFASDNQIHASWELFHLRTLPVLEVLALDGNGMQARSDYRHFVIYHLDAIAVLDGVMVEADQVKAAWQRFDSKLSLDLLVDLKGEVELKQMTKLDLPSAGIRDVLSFWSEQGKLAQLTSINLQDNKLTTFIALGDLSSLHGAQWFDQLESSLEDAVWFPCLLLQQRTSSDQMAFLSVAHDSDRFHHEFCNNTKGKHCV